ncbi:MAG: hypothetical protein JWL70_991 [Acidimicrobiia bacterium]|nr:hypothetical protein [Acidimicrobiia bacterium]
MVLRMDTAAPPAGFAAFVRALAEFVELRADGPGPALVCQGGAVGLADGSAVEFPRQPLWLDYLLPLPPFLRARARQIRGLPEVLVVGADQPAELVEVASMVTAPAGTGWRDLVQALALGSVVQADPELAAAHGLEVGVQVVVEPTAPAHLAPMLSRQAARWARQHHDPRRAARLLVERLGLDRYSPPLALRQTCEQMHGGWLGRVDARLARAVGGSWE